MGIAIALATAASFGVSRHQADPGREVEVAHPPPSSRATTSRSAPVTKEA
jgi:hypothetical protein